MYYSTMGYKRKYRTVVFYKKYFENFFERQTAKVKEKIIWTFELIEEFEKIPATYLKHLSGTNGLYEIRVKAGKNIFRVFCFLTRTILS